MPRPHQRQDRPASSERKRGGTARKGNPAHIHVGDTYNDLGAIITAPEQDKNLDIKTYLNGALVSNIVIDTSAEATDTIDYVATDAAGNTSTSTRTVLIEAANDNAAISTATITPSAVNDNTPPQPQRKPSNCATRRTPSQWRFAQFKN